MTDRMKLGLSGTMRIAFDEDDYIFEISANSSYGDVTFKLAEDLISVNDEEKKSIEFHMSREDLRELGKQLMTAADILCG